MNADERAGRVGPYPYYGATGQVGWIDDYLFDEELVLLGEDGAPFLDGAKPKAYVIRGKTWVNNHAHVLRSPVGTPALFWKYQLDHIDYRPFVSGTTRLKLPQGPMVEIPLLVPPREEQARIAEALDSYNSRLEEATILLERVQRNLKRYRASVLKAAVEGRLVPTEAELARSEKRDYEPASALLKRILDERRQRWEAERTRGRYEEPEAPDTSKLPKLPQGWCWSNVTSLCDVGTGATPLRGRDLYWRNGTIPWVTSSVVNQSLVEAASEFVTEAALNETNLKVYPIGTLLIAMYGEGKTRGKVTELGLAAATNQALAALVLPPAATPYRRWLRLFLEHNYERLRQSASGGVQPNLNLSLIKEIPIPLPPPIEADRIVRETDRTTSHCSRMLGGTELQQLRIARLRQSILKWAFEGKLVDQDPNDESASALLDRIRAEKAAAQPTARKNTAARTAKRK